MNHYKDQIQMIEKFTKIKKSYEKSIEKRLNLSSQPSETIQMQFNDDDANFSSDDDDDDDEEGEFNGQKSKEVDIIEDGDESDDIQNDIFSRMDLHLFKKEPKLIVLFNTDSIHEDYLRVDRSNFFSDIKSRINLNGLFSYFININDNSTYREFLTKLHEQILASITDYESSLERLDFYEMTNIQHLL